MPTTVPNSFTGKIKTITYTYPKAESAATTLKPPDLKLLGDANRRIGEIIE